MGDVGSRRDVYAELVLLLESDSGLVVIGVVSVVSSIT